MNTPDYKGAYICLFKFTDAIVCSIEHLPYRGLEVNYIYRKLKEAEAIAEETILSSDDSVFQWQPIYEAMLKTVHNTAEYVAKFSHVEYVSAICKCLAITEISANSFLNPPEDDLVFSFSAEAITAIILSSHIFLS